MTPRQPVGCLSPNAINPLTLRSLSVPAILKGSRRQASGGTPSPAGLGCAWVRRAATLLLLEEEGVVL